MPFKKNLYQYHICYNNHICFIHIVLIVLVCAMHHNAWFNYSYEKEKSIEYIFHIELQSIKSRNNSRT